MVPKEMKKEHPRRGSISRLRKPEDLSLEAWQIALRRQFASRQRFRLKNIGKEAIFSEFQVTNPQSRRTYRMAIRGEGLGVNYCSCPDFATNTLGTCKHIEFALARLRRRPGAGAAFQRGFQPAYSEVFLRYGARRQAIFRPGTQCPDSLRELADPFFKSDGSLWHDAFRREPWAISLRRGRRS